MDNTELRKRKADVSTEQNTPNKRRKCEHGKQKYFCKECKYEKNRPVPMTPTPCPDYTF